MALTCGVRLGLWRPAIIASMMFRLLYLIFCQLVGWLGLLARALSMAAGEYVSVRSQRELLAAASQELDGPALRALAGLEAEELGLVFRARGMAVDQAERRAAALGAGGDDQPAGEDDADAAGTDVVGSAVGAAGFSFVAFATGAAIPILPFLVTTGTAAILAAAIVVGVALFAIGGDGRGAHRRIAAGPGPAPARHRRGRRGGDLRARPPLRDHDRLTGPGDCRTLSGNTGRDIQRQW